MCLSAHIWIFMKIHWIGLNMCQYCFANISATKARIFMKFYVVVNFYLVYLSFEFNEDPWINVSAQVLNMCAPISSICESYIKPVGIFGNYTWKSPDIRRKRRPISLHKVPPGQSNKVSSVGRRRTLRKLNGGCLYSSTWEQPLRGK